MWGVLRCGSARQSPPSPLHPRGAWAGVGGLQHGPPTPRERARGSRRGRPLRGGSAPPGQGQELGGGWLLTPGRAGTRRVWGDNGERRQQTQSHKNSSCHESSALALCPPGTAAPAPPQAMEPAAGRYLRGVSFIYTCIYSNLPSSGDKA